MDEEILILHMTAWAHLQEDMDKVFSKSSEEVDGIKTIKALCPHLVEKAKAFNSFMGKRHKN